MADGRGKKARISFTVHETVPSKSNYRYSRRQEARDAWARIVAYEQVVKDAAIKAGAKKVKRDTKVAVTLVAYNQPVDPDNLFKATIDALKKVCFKDDSKKYIRRLVMDIKEDKKGRRMRVKVEWD